MQISGNISGNSVSLSSSDQQITSVTTPAIVGAGSTLTVTLSTVGYNPGDTVYWSATGTTINSTGSGVVSNSLGIIGSASLAVPISSYDIGTIQVFILKSQASSIVSQTAGPVSINQYYGYIAGGQNNSTGVAAVYRIDFATDSATASVRGPLTRAVDGAAAVSNASYGWFSGGTINGAPSLAASSRIDRIDFANDSPTTAIARSRLSDGRVFAGGVSNAAYGWFGSGGANYGPAPNGEFQSNIDRLDFANDSVAASIRGPLTISTNSRAATGNTNYGWFAGGSVAGPGTPAYISTTSVERIDYANDLVSSTRRGNLAVGRGDPAATGNADYGWFGGGYSSTPSPFVTNLKSRIDRITYSNDSPAAASPRSPLSFARHSHSASGNAAYGWFSGGYTSSGARVSSVDRMEYTNDTVTTSVRGPLPDVKVFAANCSTYVK